MNTNYSLDHLDKKILARLQCDATESVSVISEAAGLSQNATWRRIKLMEEAGYIKKRVAILDEQRLNAGMTVFVLFKLVEHSPQALEKFARVVGDMAQALEFSRISGEFDYMLKLQVADIAAYDVVYKKLISTIRLSDVRAFFAMEILKRTTALPLG